MKATRRCVRTPKAPRKQNSASNDFARSAFGVRCVLASLLTRRKIFKCYLHGPGTGITNLPSFSATKFSLELVELPLASFFSTLMLSFLVGLSVRQTLPPVGESIGVVASFTSSGVRLISSIVVIFSPASPAASFVKTDNLWIGALGVEE